MRSTISFAGGSSEGGPRSPTKYVVAGALLLVGLWFGGRRVGPLPALGSFLDPVRGVWAVSTTAQLPQNATANLAGLDGEVEVVYDDRGVPHIFASSVRDATRALGYVVARDRLFQLEIQTRATAGRLTELLGAGALPADRNQRELGLAWSAERDFAKLDADSELAELLRAYAAGVNAWIDGLSDKELPLEFRLIGADPSPWRPQYSLYLLKRMGWILSYVPVELAREAVALRVGADAAAALLPKDSPIQQPIQPNGSSEPRFDFAPLPPPAAPSQSAAGTFRARQLARFNNRGTDVTLGSNNWAVGPTKSTTGHAILAGDPHLNMTVPSIWYEVHLVVPGELDVYGVTIPGTPGIVIGFNRYVAWSFTNTGADVADFYTEQFDDNQDPTAYLLDGEWRPLDIRVEEYRGRANRVIATDTIYHTHRGPVLRDSTQSLSLRWTVLEDQGELEAFHGAAQARTVDEWLNAMTSYVAPAQNGIVADHNGSIAIRSTGRFPLRPDDGRGDVIRDGTSSESDWVGAWPVSWYPFSIDPVQGFLASANQEPVDPLVSDRYLGADWPSPWRAMQINKLLRESGAVSPDDLQRFQTDPGSARADVFVPEFLDAVDRLSEHGPLDDTLRIAADFLRAWDRRYTRENTRAVLFERAMTELVSRTWDELEDSAQGGRRVTTPVDQVLAGLLADSASPWWDHRQTAKVETRDDILAASLRAAISNLRGELGDENGESWSWERNQKANIFHLLRIPSLSVLDVPVQGGNGTLNPSSGSGTHGASFRMVVELGDSVRARLTYPGGQSGHPLSRRYADRVDEWSNGELSDIRFPRSRHDLADEAIEAVLTLRPSSQ